MSNLNRIVPSIAIPLLMMGLLIGCSEDRGRLAGSGSVTTNGLTGMVTRDGQPASGIVVSVYPEKYNPVRDSALPDSWRQLTDRSGKFRFENIAAGAYAIVASRPLENARAIVQGILISADADSQYTLADLALNPGGDIRIPLPEFARDVSGYFYLPGTGLYAVLDSTALRSGEIHLADVPSADYAALLYVKPGSDSERNVLAHALAVAPEGLETVKPYALWKTQWKVSINTSASGADVPETLAGFPMLIRLNAGNFDFASARPDGADLRFTKSDSITALPYEIETWDASARTAAIWVRMDTVRGGDASQFLCMFAGNADATRGPKDVFDTASGFRGIWHLGEDPAKGGQAILDRTVNGYAGTASGGMTSDASVAGVIGKGLQLDGKKNLIILPNSDLLIRAEGQPLTLSAWIKPSALKTVGDSICNRLISFMSDSAGFSSLAWGIDDSGRLAHYTRATDSVYHWATPIKADSVYFVALTFAGGKYVGYVNGHPDFEASGLVMPAGGAQPALVGAHESGNRQFQGLMDELRIERVTRGAGWIRLAFESQKPGAAMVQVTRSN